MHERNSKKTVVVGMSGGVDSSVAALLLQRAGWNVMGVFLKLYSETKHPLTGECAYLEDLKMAKKVALLLGIPLHVLDFEKEYQKNVLRPMFDAYRKGLTPNPDLVCNKVMKFPLLWKAAKKFGAESVATGHYARVRKKGEEFQLLMGKDMNKDQSYFLAELSQNELSGVLFPVGNLKKEEVRAIARKAGLPNWNKHGTVGICFVGQQEMHTLLKKNIRVKKGEVLLPSGEKIGTHEGVALYTIGQKALPRWGIRIEKPVQLAQQRLYVAAKEVQRNTLVVAPAEHPLLKKKEIALTHVHFINPKQRIPSRMQVRIRHLGKLHTGRLIKKKQWKWTFAYSQEAAAPGQSAVLYQKEQVLGCGTIM